MTDRILPLDVETARNLKVVGEVMAVRPFEKLFGGRYTWGVKLALGFAKSRGFIPDPTFDPPKKDGRPLYSVHVDTVGMFEDLEPPQVSSLVRLALRHYLAGGTPRANGLRGRDEEPVEMPESMIRQIAARAFEQRISYVEAGSKLVDQACLRLVDSLPNPADTSRTVYFRPEPGIWKAARIRTLDLGYPLDALLVREVGEMFEGTRAP